MKAGAERWEKMSVGAHQCKESIRPPGPVSNYRINETRDCETIEQISYKSGAPDHCTRSNRRARICKSKLEQPECQERNTGSFVCCRHILKEEPVITDEPISMTEHERKAESKEKNAAEARVHDAFHQDVHGFPRSAETGLEHGESNLHCKNQECCQQGPKRVDRIDDVVTLEVGISGKSPKPQQFGQHSYEADK